jgi:Peptidase family M23
MTSRNALLAALAGALALGAALPATGAAAAKRTPLYVSVLSPPAPVLGTDGRRHLAYELILENEGGGTAEIRSLSVRARGGRELLRLTGDQVAGPLENFGYQPTTTLGATEGGRMVLDVTLPRRAHVPRALVHRFTVRTVSAGGDSRAWVFGAASTAVRRRPPVKLSPPLRGGRYIDFNGCCARAPHRGAITALNGRAYLSERFAMDLIQIDAQGAAAAGDLTKNESFFTFGEPVLAVADARVVTTLDTLPENVPLNEPPALAFSEKEIAGNTVILDLGHGRFAAYGHLQTGSVRVKAGQRVRRGQVIARVGNTGPSGAPHLHLQVMDGRDLLASDGLPFVFRRFTLAGDVTNLGEFLTGAAPAAVQPSPRNGRRRGEMPLMSSVVRFAR